MYIKKVNKCKINDFFLIKYLIKKKPTIVVNMNKIVKMLKLENKLFSKRKLNVVNFDLIIKNKNSL